MKVVLDGSEVGIGCEASYNKHVACFIEAGLNRFNILHEFYHNLVYRNRLEMVESTEGSKANRFARVIVRS